jgi:hypothetical protein
MAPGSRLGGVDRITDQFDIQERAPDRSNKDRGSGSGVFLLETAPSCAPVGRRRWTLAERTRTITIRTRQTALPRRCQHSSGLMAVRLLTMTSTVLRTCRFGQAQRATRMSNARVAAADEVYGSVIQRQSELLADCFRSRPGRNRGNAGVRHEPADHCQLSVLINSRLQCGSGDLRRAMRPGLHIDRAVVVRAAVLLSATSRQPSDTFARCSKIATQSLCEALQPTGWSTTEATVANAWSQGVVAVMSKH